jgi:hypothetical protein
MNVKLEAGQWWMSRGGGIRYVVGRGPLVGIPHQDVHSFLILHDPNASRVSWSTDDGLSIDGMSDDLVEHLPDCDGFDWVASPKLQLREGAWYERQDGKIVGPCVKYGNKDRPWAIDVYLYSDEGINSATTLSHIVREVDPPKPPKPKYRPFASRDEALAHCNGWWIDENGIAAKIFRVSESGIFFQGRGFVCFNDALNTFKRQDGTPFGVVVENE